MDLIINQPVMKLIYIIDIILQQQQKIIWVLHIKQEYQHPVKVIMDIILILMYVVNHPYQNVSFFYCVQYSAVQYSTVQNTYLCCVG